MHGISYLKVARGRWKTIVALGIVGVAVGWAVTAASGKPAARPRAVYSATHTLVLAPSDDASGRSTDDRESTQTLDAAALLVTVGQIPLNVATALGIDADQFIDEVTTTTNSSVGVLQITTTLRDSSLAADVSNTLAQELVTLLTAQAQQRYDAELVEAEADLKDLRSQLDKLPPLPPIVPGSPPDQVKNVPREALGEQFQVAADRLYRLSAQGPPAAGFVTLQEAEPVQIDPVALARQQQQASRGQARTTSAGSPSVTTPEAVVPAAPAKPTDKRVVMAIAGLMGLLCGAGLALLAERLAPRVRTRDDAEAGSGLPVIGEIPRLSWKRRRQPQIATVAEPSGLEADAYRHLRGTVLCASPAALMVASNGHAPHVGAYGHVDVSAGGSNGNGQKSPDGARPGLRVSSRDRGSAVEATPGPGARPIGRDLCAILVTSPAAGEGKTSTVVNLAAVLAEAGKSVVVLDLDLRQSKMHEFVAQPGSAGLSELLTSGEDDAIAELHRVAPDSGVRYLLSGGPAHNPSELLASERSLVSEARSSTDLVLIDAPPLLATSDAAELAPVVDAVVLVFRAGTTTMESANRASEKLARMGTSVLGVVLMEAPILRAARSYHPRNGILRRRTGKPVARRAPVPATNGVVAPQPGPRQPGRRRRGADEVPAKEPVSVLNGATVIEPSPKQQKLRHRRSDKTPAPKPGPASNGNGAAASEPGPKEPVPSRRRGGAEGKQK